MPSTLQYCGRAIVRSVQIGGEMFDQFSQRVRYRTSPMSEPGDFVRFLPLFQEYDIFHAEIALVSILNR
jgi:hypothetical protein